MDTSNILIGSMIGYHGVAALREQLSRISANGMNACQLNVPGCGVYTEAETELVRETAESSGVKITAVWAGWDGPAEWNFTGGPSTLGIIPLAYRSERVRQIKNSADFAHRIGVTDVITHAGFLPEDMHDEKYIGAVCALRELARYLAARGQYFLFETGQETPVTLLRCIEDIGTGNLGVNFDTANLILYGKANSADAAGILGKYIRNTHIKDGFYPTNGRELGREVALGEGLCNFPAVARALTSCGYSGPYIIEREISGEQQNADIIRARDIILGALSVI